MVERARCPVPQAVPVVLQVQGGVVERARCPAPQAVPVVRQVQGGVVDHADDDHGEGHALQKDGGVAHHDDVGQDEAGRAPSGGA